MHFTWNSFTTAMKVKYDWKDFSCRYDLDQQTVEDGGVTIFQHGTQTLQQLWILRGKKETWGEVKET